jgi:hypothetical protein
MEFTTTLRFPNGMSLQLHVVGRRLWGIGRVRFQGKLLRSALLPWTVYAESERGLRFEDFTLVDVAQSADGATVVFESAGRWLPRLQAADMMGDSRIASRRLRPAVATFRWTFRPIAEQIEENTWTGLAMQLEVDSPGHPIHWILEDATWELGGQADGCTLIQQDVTAIDLEQSVDRASAFSTAEVFHTEGGGAIHPMDMMPRAAGAAICDFQAKGDTALVLFAERPGLTRSRIDKHLGENVIHYADRPFFPLTEHARPPERKLLVYRHRRRLARHEWRNLWLDCFTEVRRRMHRAWGFQLEVPVPTVHSHLWDQDLKRYGPAWHEPLIRALPDFRRLGYQEFFTHGVWESVTSDAARAPEDGNICCPYAFRFAEAFGGAAGMKRLVDAAHAAGLRVYQWFGFQFARFSPLWKEHPEWLLREADGDPWDGNYQVLWCGRMRSGFRDLLLDQIRKVRDDTGIDGIFWDSYQNLGVTCVDWQAPDKAPQAEEIWALQTELQKYGYKQRAESITVFGVSQVGMFGFEAGEFRKRLWSDAVRRDEAFALLDTSPAFFSRRGDPFVAERLGPADYFWLAGHRAVPIVGARPWDAPADAGHAGPALPGGAIADQYARVNHLYNAALPRMHRLRLLEGGAATLWLDAAGRPAIVWAFRDGRLKFSGRATDLETGSVTACRRTVPLAAGKVYRLEAAAEPDPP